MKYLKLFENLSADGYESIGDSHMAKLFTLDNIESFNDDNEFRIISESLKNYNKYIDISLDSFNDVNCVMANNRQPNNRVRIIIYKLKDEWFILTLNLYKLDKYDRITKYYTINYYKCDQLSGLINCIESLTKIITPTI